MKSVKIFLFIFTLALFVSACGKDTVDTKARATVRLLNDNKQLHLDNIDTIKYKHQDTLTFIYDLDEKFVPGWKISRIPYSDTIITSDINHEVMYRRGVIEEFR